MLLLFHVGDRRLCQRKSAIKMHIHKILKILNADLLDRFLAVPSCIVDYNIDRTVIADDPVDHRLGRTHICNIMYDIMYSVAQLCTSFLKHLLPSSHDHDHGSGRRHALCGCITKPASSACNQGNLSRKLKCPLKILIHFLFLHIFSLLRLPPVLPPAYIRAHRPFPRATMKRNS